VRAVTFFALAASLLVYEPDAARAENEPAPAAPADVAVGRAHFQRGVELYRSGAYDAALAEFSRANEAAPSFRILYNLGQIQAQRHDYVASHALFARYLEEGAEHLPESRVRAVRDEMLELERRISRLRVEVNVDDVRLFIDDRPVVSSARDEPLLLNAGIYRLRAEKNGYVSAARTVTLTGGGDTSISLELSAELDMDESPSPVPPPAPPPLPLPADRSALWASLAATGVLTGASITFGLLARRANTTLDTQLARMPAPREGIEESRSRVRTYALLTDICGVAAAAALGLTTYFYLSLDEPTEGLAPRGLRPELGAQSAALTWSGDF
jgi:hypothetical protein